MSDALRRLTMVAGMILLVGLVHLASVMLLPALAPTDAWTRLGRFETEPGFQVLPAATPEASPLRMTDPATVVALCRYDLDEDGAIAVTGRAAAPYWGLSLHNRQGAVYYALNNRGVGERPLDLRITTAEEVERLRAELPDDAERNLLVAAPEPRGFVMLRALAPEPSARPAVEAEVRKLACQPVE